MAQQRVVIVGAGPAGLVAALALEQNGIESIILEREKEVTQDPRGVYLAGDAVRILWSLGLGDEMSYIGHKLSGVDFHASSFTNPPFQSLDLETDTLQQAVPTGILQMQPRLESVLRKRVEASKLCDFRTGCEVKHIQQNDDGVQIEYISPDGSIQRLNTAWLIGADGKKGAVRKEFLEREAGIQQVYSDYRYDGTWIAANLKITLPTPDTHPNFRPWRNGLTAEEVYDLFWPKKWHFCSPPGKPTATGRFGPHEERFWRHEFRQDNWDEKVMDSEQLMWEHLNPMITRTADSNGIQFGESVTFPQDCIQILRCRPFTFTHKVVNRWFHRQTVLIGDAAHVFPPFGGQGIASGIRDAHQLAWRIALVEGLPHHSPARTNRLLNAWAIERAHSVKSAAQLTQMNGMLCNQGVSVVLWIIRAVEWVRKCIFWLKERYDPQTSAERLGYQKLTGAFVLSDHGGGKRVPQIYLDSINERRMLSDDMFKQASTPFRLIALVDGNATPDFGRSTIAELLSECQIPEAVLALDSFAIISTSPCTPESIGSFATPTARKFAPASNRAFLSGRVRPGYDDAAFRVRLGPKCKYAIVRPDFFVFATAKNLAELRVCLQKLKDLLESG